MARFYGWRIVGAAFVLAFFGWGLGFYGPPVYLQAVREARGFSLGVASLAVTIHFLAGALVASNLPRLFRRYGLPSVVKVAAVALSVGVFGWASAAVPWQLFAAAVVSGAGWAAMSGVTVNAVIAPWFVRARPAALSTAYNGASLAGLILSPLWVTAIIYLGFPVAAAGIGLVTVIAAWFLATQYFAQSPAGLGLAPDGDTPGWPARSITSPRARALPGGSLWRNVGFLTLVVGTSLTYFAQIGLIAHLYSLLVSPLGQQWAGIVMGVGTGAGMCGRMAVGWLMPVDADRRLVICASYAVQIAGAMILFAAGGNIPLLLLGVLLFGLGIGNTTSLPPLIAQVEFVKEDVPRVVALVIGIGQAVYAFAPAVFGLIRELANGGGALVFAVAGVLQALSIGTMLLGRYSSTKSGRA